MEKLKRCSNLITIDAKESSCDQPSNANSLQSPPVSPVLSSVSSSSVKISGKLSVVLFMSGVSAE